MEIVKLVTGIDHELRDLGDLLTFSQILTQNVNNGTNTIYVKDRSVTELLELILEQLIQLNERLSNGS